MAYQLIILGAVIKFKKYILDLLFKEIDDLGIDRERLNIIYARDFKYKYRVNYPVYCLYVGSDQEVDLDILEKLINDVKLILPIVFDLSKFSQQIPKILLDRNGFELSDDSIPSLVSCILEGFNLLRVSRKVFISYKRSESSNIAIQLYEALEKAGFNVFLDTHCIRPGQLFQAELWHRMSDSEIVLLLNTKNFLLSNWTVQELAKANALSIGIVQIVWPNIEIIPEAQLCESVILKDIDFLYSCIKLKNDVIKKIISATEILRARTLSARQDNLTTEFIKFARILNIKTTLHQEKFISVYDKKNNEYAYIPTVGIPQSLTFNNAESLIKRVRKNHICGIYVLYDHLNVIDSWLWHLNWLNKYLPVKSIKLFELKKELLDYNRF